MLFCCSPDLPAVPLDSQFLIDRLVPIYRSLQDRPAEQQQFLDAIRARESSNARFQFLFDAPSEPSGVEYLRWMMLQPQLAGRCVGSLSSRYPLLLLLASIVMSLFFVFRGFVWLLYN
jgi:hypothetical protein